MQASLNQMNSCNSGTKLSVFFSANFWRHTPSRKRGCDPEIGMNEKCVDFRALMDSWWDWNSRTAARLNLWTSTFKVMDWFVKPGKYPNWKQNLPRSQPTTFYGSIYATQGPMPIARKISNSASCTGTKPRGSSSQNCRIWACEAATFLGDK